MSTATARTNHLEVHSDRGAMAVIVASLVPMFLILCAIAVDVSAWYVEVNKVQKAADASALAGVTWLPNDMTNATAQADAAGVKNGFLATQVNAYRTDAAGNSLPPSQLRVVVSRTVTNFFGRLFGMNTQTITRSAIADFQAPAIMGNPCNTFGNEPSSNSGYPATGTIKPAQPAGSVLPSPGFATCTTNPQFWGTIQGPATNKLQGDRYMTQVCTASSVDNCTGSTNNEYKPEGYFFVVRVQPAAVNKSISLQLYDAAHVVTGTRCENLPSSGITDGMNPYAPDATTRYATSFNATTRVYCPGDYDPGGSGTNPRLDTTFALREQLDTLRPLDAPLISQCIKTFRGDNTAPTANELKATNGSYNQGLAKVFHQWVELCTFTPTRSGDYYLQVRTNIAAGLGTGEANTNSNLPMIYSLTPTQFSGATLNTAGRGNNGFAMRAHILDGTAGTAVAVAGWERMPIFVNATAASSTLNLIRVTPNAAGANMTFSYFDVGDAANSGTVQVLKPVGSTGSALGTCRYTGPGATSGALTNCTASISNTTHNGRIQTITVPIPADYSCNVLDPGSCWFQTKIVFSTGNVNDITTWDAGVQGDPVRLVR